MKKPGFKYLSVSAEPQLKTVADLMTCDTKEPILTTSLQVVDHIRATADFLSVDFSEVILCGQDGTLSTLVTGEAVEADKGAEFYKVALSGLVSKLTTEEQAKVFKFILNGCKADQVTRSAPAGKRHTTTANSSTIGLNDEEKFTKVKGLILDCVKADKLPAVSNKVDGDDLMSPIALSSTPDAKKFARAVWGQVFAVPEGEKSIDARAIPTNYGALKNNEVKRQDYLNSLKDHLDETLPGWNS